MLIKRLISLIVFITIFNFSFAIPKSHNQVKNILVLFSLVPSTPAYRIILDGIRQELSEEFGEDFNLYMEYIETERYPKGNYPKERFDIYNEKYRDIRLDVLICVGIDILPTIKQFASSKLLHLPTLSLDYDFSSFGYKSELSLNDITAVFPIKVDPVSTIAASLALFPQRKSVFIISGVSNTDKIFLSITKDAIKQLKAYKIFSFLSDISMDDVLKKVRHLPSNSIIIIPYFNVDSKMVPYYNPESIRLISKNANSPVFAYSDMGLGDGSVGGYLISFKKIARKMGETTVKILMGTDPNSIKLTNNDVYEYLYDWRELKRWDIDKDLIPAHSTILFEEITFFGKYRWIIMGGIFFLLLQFFLILSLVFLYRKQNLTTLHLKESENKYRGLLHEDRILRTGQLTASLSHELNQPLTAILSTAQAGIRFIDSGNPEPVILKDILQKIVENDKRAASIITSIRGMLKLEKREKEKVNLNDLIEELLTIYRREAEDHQIQLKLELTDAPVFIIADRILIQQVILNFLSNATHSMDKITGKNKFITISERIEADNVIVSVRDHGIGLNHEVKEVLFRPFSSSMHEGMGVGLAICRSIIDDHQGTISAKNIPGSGAEFSFSLKIYHDE